MGSLKRTLRRRKEKREEEDLKEKLGLFSKLGDECMVCSRPFDKTKKEDVQSFYVFVNKEAGRVNLYCPDCWNKAQEIVEDFQKIETPEEG